MRIVNETDQPIHIQDGETINCQGEEIDEGDGEMTVRVTSMAPNMKDPDEPCECPAGARQPAIYGDGTFCNRCGGRLD